MPYVLIIHEVADYDKWKRIFDNAADLRREAGERAYRVLRFEQNSHNIVHFSSWTSLDDAKQFFESPKLISIRAEAGVKSPQFIYLEQLDAGTLQSSQMSLDRLRSQVSSGICDCQCQH